MFLSSRNRLTPNQHIDPIIWSIWPDTSGHTITPHTTLHHTHIHPLSLEGSLKMSTITDSSGKSYSYPSPGLNPGSAALTAVGGVLCGLLGVGIGLTVVLSNFILSNKLCYILHHISTKIYYPVYIHVHYYDRVLCTASSYSSSPLMALTCTL